MIHHVDDGRIEIDNNIAEQALRGVAVGDERVAAMCSLIGSEQMSSLDPLAYLRHVLTQIADHPINRIDELLL